MTHTIDFALVSVVGMLLCKVIACSREIDWDKLHRAFNVIDMTFLSRNICFPVLAIIAEFERRIGSVNSIITLDSSNQLANIMESPQLRPWLQIQYVQWFLESWFAFMVV